MNIKLVCLEDGITSCGFRKIAAHVAALNQETEAYYVTTSRYRGIRNGLFGLGGGGELSDDHVDEVAHGLLAALRIGFSSMTGYSVLTHRIIRRVRELNPSVYMMWGGIHPIIEPEDAITADVDAICTGEGEFAFASFYEAFKDGGDYTDTKNFWFRLPDGAIKGNHLLP